MRNSAGAAAVPEHGALKAGMALWSASASTAQRGAHWRELLAAYSGSLDDGTRDWLLHVADTGNWKAAQSQLLLAIARDKPEGWNPDAHGPGSVETFQAASAVVFLTAQAAKAPLPQAAAAACLLAYVVHCGPEEATATLRVRLQRDLLAERITAALARPGMVAAMAACTNAEHAVGLLATHALLAIDEADGKEGRLLSVAAAQLAPTCLLAVLAAAGSCASGETMRLNCQNMGACMLKAVAGQPTLAAIILPDVFQAIARLLQQLDSDVGIYLRFFTSCTGSSGSGSSGSRHGSIDSAAQQARTSSHGNDGSGDVVSQKPQEVAAAASSDLWPSAAASALSRICSTTTAAAMSLVSDVPGDSDDMIDLAISAAQRLVNLYEHTLQRLAALPQQHMPALLVPLMEMLPRLQNLTATISLAGTGAWGSLRSAAVSALHSLLQHGSTFADDLSPLTGIIDLTTAAAVRRDESAALPAADTATIAAALQAACTELSAQLDSSPSLGAARMAAAVTESAAKRGGMEQTALHLSRTLVVLLRTAAQQKDMAALGITLAGLEATLTCRLATLMPTSDIFWEVLSAVLGITPTSAEAAAAVQQAATSEAAAACLEGFALLALAALKFMMADAASRQRDSWPQWAVKCPVLFDQTGVVVAWIRRAPSVIPKVAASGGATALSASMHKAATAELKPGAAAERRPGWVQDACVALYHLIQADTAAAAPLVQPDSPAQWLKVEPALRSALPQQHCKEATHAVASVTTALLHTPAGLEAARRQEAEAQQRALAAAAADAAMLQLLQEESGASASASPSKAALKRARKRAAAREAAAAAAAAAPPAAAPEPHLSTAALDSTAGPAAAGTAGLQGMHATRRPPVRQRPPDAGSARAHGAGEGAPLEAQPGTVRLGSATVQAAAERARHCGALPAVWQLCPLSKVVMVDPVLLLADSQSYERAAIKAWLETHDTSPVTGEELADKEFVPNHALRSILRGLAAPQT